MMKVYRISVVITLFIAILIVVMTGCEYDVTQPLWYQDYEEPPTPVITQIEPQTATAGVNTITIHGENFIGIPDSNGVFFGSAPAEIIQTSTTAITVRRPNIASDSCTVKIISDSALVVAKFGPYKIDRVVETYGSFLENNVLSTVAVDNAENLYVVETSSKNIIRVTPDEQQTILGEASRAPYDACIGPDGRLYLPENNRAIDVVNLETGEVDRWTRLPSGKVVKFGDFDTNGYFYTGGTRTDLVIVAPDSELTVSYANFYANDEILAIRVYNGYVYVAARAGLDLPASIWKHQLDANGNVGTQELVIDMSTTGEFASRLITAIAFSSNGTMYIATDNINPILIFGPTIDILYKGIIPPYCKHIYWGTGNYLYMISGDATAEQEWFIYRIDMGITVGS